MLNRPPESPIQAQLTATRGAAGADWFTAGRLALVLLLLFFLTFPKLLLGLHTFMYRDYGVLGYPFISYAHQSLWAGEWPLWNPLSNCGAPFLAQWGTMTLYPFSLLFLLLPLPWSLTYFCFAHLILGGLGIYFLANRWLQHRLASTLAAVIFLFNGAMFSAMLWPNYLVALGWMPWIILATERASLEGGRWIITAGLLAALQLLVGTPEIVLLTWLTIGLLAVSQLASHPKQRASLVVRLTMVVLLAAGLVAAQFLPFLDLLLHSQRDSAFQSSKWPMPGWGWAHLLVPLFHCFRTPQGPFFQYGQEFLTSYYLGIGPLVLAVWAAWTVRQTRVWILAGLTLLSLVLALGDQGLLFTWVKHLVPVTSIARYPIKFVLLTIFTVPMLAAYAFRQLHSPTTSTPPMRSLLILAGAAAVLVLVILWFAHAYPFPYDQWEATLVNGLLRLVFLGAIVGAVCALGRASTAAGTRTIGLLVIGLVYLDVVTHTARQNPSLPVSVLEPGLWQTFNPEVSAPRHGQSRAYITPQAEARLLSSGVVDLQKDLIGKRLALWSNLNLLDQIPKINGSSTLQVREQSRVQKLIYDLPGSTNPPPIGLLNFLGASITSSPSNAVEWVPLKDFLPLATAGQRARFASAEETLRALADPAFNSQQLVYLDPELEKTLPPLGSAKILSGSFGAHRIVLEVEAEAAALVVVAQSFYPAWRASVDGVSTPLWRANYAFQSLLVPAGRHQVSLSYRDNTFRLGLTISALTLGICLFAWLRLKPQAN